MFVYEILLIIGALGLAATTLLGFVHVGHHGGPGHEAGHSIDVQHGGAHDMSAAHGHAAPGHGVGGHGHGVHSHGPHDHAAGHHGLGEGAYPGGLFLLVGLLSPLTLFSLALGAGATGTILQLFGLSPGVAALPSAVGAWLFYAAVVRPLRDFISSFVSRPAQTLEGALLQEAEAITHFNARGEGLVRLVVDGQSVDVLARLQEADRGAHVRRGERVLVEDVDTHRNTVRVSRL